jgi:hypothetical protein
MRRPSPGRIGLTKPAAPFFSPGDCLIRSFWKVYLRAQSHKIAAIDYCDLACALKSHTYSEGARNDFLFKEGPRNL